MVSDSMNRNEFQRAAKMFRAGRLTLIEFTDQFLASNQTTLADASPVDFLLEGSTSGDTGMDYFNRNAVLRLTLVTEHQRWEVWVWQRQGEDPFVRVGVHTSSETTAQRLLSISERFVLSVLLLSRNRYQTTL